MKRGTRQEITRVALDTTFAGTNPTGVGLYSRRLSEELHAIAPRRGIDINCIGPTCGTRQQHGMLATAQEWPPYTQLAVPLLLAKHRPTIIHSTSHLGPLVGSPYRIVTVHDLLFRRYPQDYNRLWLWITKRLLPHVLRRATAVIADSNTTAQDLKRFYRVPDSKVKVIYPGVDVSPLSAPIQTRRAPSGSMFGEAPYILCLGPWVGRKNLGVVVEAFERLGQRHHDLRLVITGAVPRGMKGAGPIAYIERLTGGLRKRVELTGHIGEYTLRGLISGAALLAYPSRFEGFGLPPLEAMAAGVPLVASTTPAVMEVCGDAALYASPDDPDAWVDRIEYLLGNEDIRTSVITSGRKRCAQFTWERCAQECIELYLRICRIG